MRDISWNHNILILSEAISKDMTAKSNLSKSFFWSFLEQGGSSLVALITQIILARIIAPEAFGVMAILLVINSVLSTLTQSGFGMALIQKKEATARCFSTAFWMSIIIAAALYVIIFLSSPFIAQLYAMPDLEQYIKALMALLFLDAFNSVQRAYLQKNLDFKALFNSNFLAILLGSLTGIVLALLGFGVWALIAQIAAQSLCACIVMTIQVPWKPSFDFSKKDARSLFNYGWKICATGILNTFYTGLSELILGKTTTKTDLGYFSQGRKWPVAAMGAVVNALQNVLFPVFSDLQNDAAALREAVKDALLTSSYITIPVCLLATVIAEPVIVLLLTDIWLPCVPVFQMTCLGYAFIMPQVVNLRAYMALGDSGLYLKLQIIKVVSGALLFCTVALFTENIYYVAIAVFAHTVFSVIVVDMQPAKRMHGLGRKEQLLGLLPIVTLSIVSAIFASLIPFINTEYILQMILQIVVFCSVYLLGSKVFRIPGGSNCLNAIKNLLNKQ